MSEEKSTDNVFKFLLVGNESVGKTCIINRLVNDNFGDITEATLGVDFFTHDISIDGKNIRLQIWDTAGQEKYRSLGRAYYRNAVGVFFVFSVLDHKSYESIESWFKEVIPLCHKKVQVAIIGNKTDLIDKREVTTNEAQKLANTLNIPFFETSAKTGSGISEAFMQITRQIFTLVKTNEMMIDSDAFIDVYSDDESSKESRKCCK